MNALVVYAHPEPTSFTGALKDVSVRALRGAGHAVELSDLHAEGFNPVAGRHDFTTVADPQRSTRAAVSFSAPVKDEGSGCA